MLSPEQTAEGVAVVATPLITRATFTGSTTEESQPHSVAVIVYTVVEDGEAVTLVPEVELRPVDGDHEYEVPPPETDNVVLLPEPQMNASEVVVAREGLGSSVIVIADAVAVMPELEQ